MLLTFPTPMSFEPEWAFDYRLRAVMKQRDMTPTELAEYLGCTRQAVYKWLNRKARPDAKYWAPLADLAGMPIADLLFARPRVDPDIFVAVEGIIRRWEDEHEREIPTEQRGKLAATIYEALDETDNPLSRRQVESMLEFAGNNARRR